MAEYSYTIERMVPRFYMDEGGQVVQGYEVQFRVQPGNQIFSVNAPDVKLTTVRPIVEHFLSDYAETMDELST